MSYPISPWIDAAERVSPDGQYRAIIREAWEIAMGGPTSGVLVVSENRPRGRTLARIECCNPSFVWSSDSRALAVPTWTHQRQQKLVIVSLPSGQVRTSPEEYQVLELHSFENEVVRAIDRPSTSRAN